MFFVYHITAHLLVSPLSYNVIIYFIYLVSNILRSSNLLLVRDRLGLRIVNILWSLCKFRLFFILCRLAGVRLTLLVGSSEIRLFLCRMLDDFLLLNQNLKHMLSSIYHIRVLYSIFSTLLTRINFFYPS